MSDFDQFFADRLNEEQEFPRREKNWGHLSKRLDAFAIGNTGNHLLRHVYWKAAAVFFMAATAMMFWKMNSIQHELAALRQDIMTAQAAKAAPGPQSSQLNPAPVQSAETTLKTNTTATPNLSASSSYDRPQAVEDHSALSVLSPSKPNKQTSANSKHSPIDPSLTPSNTPNQSSKKNQPLQTAQQHPSPNENPGTPVPGAKTAATEPNQAVAVNQAAAAPTSQQTSPAAADTPGATAQVAAPTQGAVDKTGSPTPAVDQKKPENAAQAQATPAAPQKIDSVATQAPIAAKQTDHDTTAKTAAVVKPPAAETPPPPPIVKPVRTNYRFRAGVYVMMGIQTPKQRGVSTLKGQGVAVAYSPFRNLNVYGSVDFSHFKINTDSFRHEFPFPEPKQDIGQGQPHKDLEQIDANMSQRNITLGVQYTVPLHFWVRPAVRLSHTWVHIDPDFVSARFEEHHGGFPPPPFHDYSYTVLNPGAKNFDNIWRAGIGLEYESARWVFALWADYAKNLNSPEAGFDHVYVQAGASYKF
jgi:hypothetical protein